MIPDCAARPGCSCLVEEPVARNSSSPPAWLPAMPSALTVVAASRPIRREATRAEATTPATEVACRPRPWNACGTAPAIRQTALVADDRGEQALLAAGTDLLTDREHGREHGGGGVHEPAGVGVVEVEGVHERAVRECGSGRRDALGRGRGSSTQPGHRARRPRSRPGRRRAAGRPRAPYPARRAGAARPRRPRRRVRRRRVRLERPGGEGLRWLSVTRRPPHPARVATLSGL